MSGWTLHGRATPTLRIDLRGITPNALAALTAAEIERLPLGCGNALVPLAEFFRVEPRADDDLVFAADLARGDRLGWKMDGGRILVEGGAGDYAGACMSGGEIVVRGSVRDLAACEMAGGLLKIEGDAGDFAAATLPGSMAGMRGGTLVVAGRAGARFADRMRRGSAIVHGDVGAYAASRLVAGTVAIGGRIGAHGGYGMRRGSLVLAGGAVEPPPTFVPALGNADVFWQLLARDLARQGGPFQGLAARRAVRHLGDLAADGRGEWIVAAP
ncbi:MAG: formylmethanofuran dehydrogenase subunit C [Burkholderiales bacterium]|nr:formylmethanofuran dehydrogenase subunit C [Burkholderiales bacterium]